MPRGWSATSSMSPALTSRPGGCCSAVTLPASPRLSGQHGMPPQNAPFGSNSLLLLQTLDLLLAPPRKPEPTRAISPMFVTRGRSEEHTSELQSLRHLVCRLLLEKKKKKKNNI